MKKVIIDLSEQYNRLNIFFFLAACELVKLILSVINTSYFMRIEFLTCHLYHRKITNV
jgi:hypothetical protein